MKFFDSKNIAEQYAQHRPYFHPLVVERIKKRLQLHGPVGSAMDIGCGTGQSTNALKEIADFVIGADVSAHMLRVARKNSGIPFILNPAEELPVRSGLFDVLTTSLAFHWFDPTRFFAEARRVLKERAWLVISNNGFSGQMEGNPAFEDWFLQVYDRRYPSPPRNETPMTAEIALQHGFQFSHEEQYQNKVKFRVEELAAYLVTQSNVITATEQGNVQREDVYRWLLTQTQPLFKTERPTFLFRGYIWYLQKTST